MFKKNHLHCYLSYYYYHHHHHQIVEGEKFCLCIVSS